MSCYMTGYMDVSFLRLVAGGLAPRRKKSAGRRSNELCVSKND